MSEPVYFQHAQELTLAKVLEKNALSFQLLHDLKYGSLLWNSDASVYFVILDLQKDDESLPYCLKICRVAEDEDDEVVMASCRLTLKLQVVAPEFQGGLTTTEEDFTRYLEMALEDVDSSPRVIDEESDDEDFDDE